MNSVIAIAAPTADEADITVELTKAAEALSARYPLTHPELQRAAAALSNGQAEPAGAILSRALERRPDDPDALHLMAQAAMSELQYGKAEGLLLRCLRRSPHFELARFNYAKLLLQQNKTEQSIRELEFLLAVHTGDFLYRDLKALALSRLGRHAESAECYRRLTDDYPHMPIFWMRYAYELKVLGTADACVTAYRRAIQLCPSLGGAYWSLSDLKTFHFTEADIEAMESQLNRTGLSAQNRAYFHFALANAFDAAARYGEAFAHYVRANALRRIGLDYDPGRASAQVAARQALFTRQFFELRAGSGAQSGAPVFVVGMHRAGSTLVEQILSSHSAIESIGEAPEIPVIARRLETEIAPQAVIAYPDIIGRLDVAALRRLGEEYIESICRRCTLQGRSIFVDKNPVNFWSIGLIHLILPKAKIIDVRRHPVGCCFSNFTASFETPLHHTYRLSDIGQYYVDYVRLMAHFDRVMPETIHRVFYEALVSDTETEVRRLLDFVGLPFEAGCLHFYKTDRAINTPSSEQVRRPINDEGVRRWRNYEPWLSPLKSALGPVVDAYPGVPESVLSSRA